MNTRAKFYLPDGLIYLDGNSLGPLPRAAQARVSELLEKQWGDQLIRGWNDCGWMDSPVRVGDRIARLIGAPSGSVVMGDTLSVKVFQSVSSALELNSDRSIILSDTGNFPTDLYMVDGLIKSLDRGHQLKLVEPEDIESALDDNVAVLMLTHVDYRTGRLHDMKALTAKARDLGIVTVWDLAHSAGAVPVDLTSCDVDFAIGCTYKYLNGGPGAPAFIYVNPKLIDSVRPALSGWLGHADPFAFDLEYSAGKGIERMRVGTPPVIALAALDAALDIWDDVDMHAIRQRSIELSNTFIDTVESQCSEVILASPRDATKRGSQVSFRFVEGYAVVQALADEGVIGDFRAPDIMRFGFTPLYLNNADVQQAAHQLIDIVTSRRYDTEAYKTRARVT